MIPKSRVAIVGWVLAFTAIAYGLAASTPAAQGPAVTAPAPAPSSLTTDLVFIPDAGIRKASAGMSGVGIDATGTVYLYYGDVTTTPNPSMVATAADGLTFGAGTVVTFASGHANDSRRTLLPDGTWRLYEFDQATALMSSSRSTDGITFQPEAGTRYTSVAADHGSVGEFDVFTEGSRVILLYLGDLFGVNNLRRAISTDNGVTFTFDQANILGDAALGTANTYVDPKTIKLPDGRRRLLVMKRVAGQPTQGGEIDSFISTNGLDYTLEAGNRLKLADFTAIPINSLNDPDIIRLADGRYRIYVAARVASTNVFSIMSATTPLPGSTSVAVSPTSLRFGATKAGAAGAITGVTPAQDVTVSFVGTGAAWTASASQPWVRITSGSGTGDGRFIVSIVDTTNALGGSTTASATITVTSTAAGNSPLTIPVTLTIDQTGGASSTSPVGQIDTPTQQAAGVVGAISVTGWAIDDIGVTSVKIYRNCLPFDAAASCQVVSGSNVVFVGDAVFVAGARPDVEAAFGSSPQSYRAGWGYLLLTNMLPHVPNALGYGGQGSLTLFAFATDVEGHVTRLGRSQTDSLLTTINMANDTIAKPFGSIDIPAQGATVSGTFANFGWALTPDSNTTGGESGDILIPTNGSTMVVFIDGAAVATVAYNQCRGNVGNPVPATAFCNDDVASIFGNATPKAALTPRTANATKYRNLDAGRAVIGAYTIDTTLLVNGSHSIAWSVTDSAGRNEGIGSRSFTVLNGGADVGDFAGQLRTSNFKLQTSEKNDGRVRSTVWYRTGFDLGTPLTPVAVGADGVPRVQMAELGRVELSLGAVQAGYLSANGVLRDLPAGSHLDPSTGTFTWAPGPGYLGTYHLVFVRRGEQIRVDVTVRTTGG